MSVMLLMLAAATAQPLQANASPVPQPIDRPQSWISDVDYPAAALADRPEGTVAFSLTVDNSGTVVNCVIRQSSGFAILDKSTCGVLAQRAKFKPAPNGSIFNGRVRWVAPDYSGATGAVSANVFKDGEDIMAFVASR